MPVRLFTIVLALTLAACEKKEFRRTEIPQRSSLLQHLDVLPYRKARRRPNTIQNISGLPQGLASPSVTG
jgi:hypothetical protein